jgi:hypothetical protein
MSKEKEITATAETLLKLVKLLEEYKKLEVTITKENIKKLLDSDKP